jgi:tetratricopeptide (TPR) repeat protein
MKKTRLLLIIGIVVAVLGIALACFYSYFVGTEKSDGVQIALAMPQVGGTTVAKINYQEPGKRAVLPSSKWVPQTFNNCGPATTSMLLQHFGFTVNQNVTRASLRTSASDRNVFMDEIKDYLKKDFDIEAKVLYNGNLNLLKRLLANGFYVVIEDWLHPNEDIGHNTLIRGYDDDEGVLIADDPFVGVGVKYRYEDFDQGQWKPFNREYMPVYRKDKEELLKAILGEDFEEEKMHRRSLEVNGIAAQNNPKDMYAWFNLGTSRYALGEYMEAKIAFEKSRELGWPKRMLWYQIQPIQTYNKLGEYQKAIELAKIGLVGNDSFSELHLEMAIAYKGLGDLTKARQEVDKALRFAPLSETAKQFLIYL